MMKSMPDTFLIPLLLLSVNTVSGQTAPDSPYQFSEDILKKIESDSTPWKYQVGAAELSFSGYYQDVLKTWDKNGVMKPRYTKTDSLLFAGHKLFNARDYIIHRSKDEEIIIINEAHHIPAHRRFTRSLLKDLYDNGYRYLGLEALFDKKINESRTLTIESGYYTHEPQFGNLISEALRLGYTVFGYEASEGKNGKDREIEQAENIQKFIENAPKGKMIIHCGYAHAFENDYPAWGKAMAGRLKENLKIDPFTIDQTMFLEKSDDQYDHEFIKLNTRNYPVVLADQNDRIYNGSQEGKQTDIVVIHPKTQFIDGRPNWLKKENHKYTIPDSRISQYPVLVLAYRTGEFEKNGIPSDVIEITDKNSYNHLFLAKGKYDIVLKDKNYQITDRYDIIVK